MSDLLIDGGDFLLIDGGFHLLLEQPSPDGPGVDPSPYARSYVIDNRRTYRRGPE